MTEIKFKRAKVSNFKLKKVISLFCLDIIASKAAPLAGLHRNTINLWYGKFRVAIYARQHQEFEKIFGEAEVDEAYFGAKRIRGFHGKLKRGRGTKKQPVFGILKRNGRVYTEIVPSCKKDILQAIIKGKVDKSAVITLMVGVDTMAWWTWDMTSISESIMATMNFQKAREFTLTALRTSGALPSADWLSLMV